MDINHADVSGINNPMYGRKMSDETKEKIRITKKLNREKKLAGIKFLPIFYLN